MVAVDVVAVVRPRIQHEVIDLINDNDDSHVSDWVQAAPQRTVRVGSAVTYPARSATTADTAVMILDDDDTTTAHQLHQLLVYYLYRYHEL